MKESMIIEKTITSLKKRLETNNNVLTLQLEEGHITEAQCTFFAPVSDDNIRLFTNQICYMLPSEYIGF